jgi:hypothetical protein
MSKNSAGSHRGTQGDEGKARHYRKTNRGRGQRLNRLL